MEISKQTWYDGRQFASKILIRWILQSEFDVFDYYVKDGEHDIIV